MAKLETHLLEKDKWSKNDYKYHAYYDDGDKNNVIKCIAAKDMSACMQYSK